MAAHRLRCFWLYGRNQRNGFVIPSFAEPVFLFPHAPPLKFPTLLRTSSWIHVVDGPLMDERLQFAHIVLAKVCGWGFATVSSVMGGIHTSGYHTWLPALTDACRVGGSHEHSPSSITLFPSIASSACAHSLLYGLLFYVPLRLCCHARTRKDVFAIRIRELMSLSLLLDWVDARCLKIYLVLQSIEPPLQIQLDTTW